MSSVGQVIGGAIGFFMPGGGALYAQIGMMIGGLIDPPRGPTIHGPRISDLSVQTSTTNAPIPRLYGTMATHGNVFWLEKDRIRERTKKKKSGGKGGGGQKVKTYTYFATFAVGLCKGPIAGVRRVWVGSKLIYDAGSDDLETIIASNQGAKWFKVYLGTDTQGPDPRMQADKGVANTPAYRGLAYLVFYDYPLKDHGNSLMGAQVKVEVVNSATVATPTYIGPAVAMVGRVVHSRDGVVTTASQGDQFFFIDPDGLWRYSGTVVYREYSQYAQVSTYTASQTILALGVTRSLSFFKTCPISNTPDEMFVARTAGGTPSIRFNWADEEIQDNLGTESFDKHYYKVRSDLYLLPSNNYLSVFNGTSFSTRTYANPTYGRTGYQPIKFTFDRVTGKTYCMLQTNNTGWQDLIELDDNADLVNLWSFNFGNTIRYFYIHGDRLAVNPPNSLSVHDRVVDTWVVQGSLAKGASDAHYFGDGVALSANGFWKIADSQTDSLVVLSSIVQKEALLSKLVTVPDLDVAELTDQVRGYRVAQVGAIRGGIEPLQAAWPFDVVQAGYKIKFLRRPKSSIVTIDSDKLMPETELQIDMEMDSQLPREVDIKYMELNREYDMSQQIAKRENTDAVNRHDIELAIVLTAEEALQKAEVLLYLWWLERYDVVFSLPPQYRGLEVSDVVTITGKWGVYELRLIEVTYTPDGRLDCKAKYNSAAVYASTAAADTGDVPGQTLGLSGPSFYKLLDIPLLTDELDTPGLLAAMCGNTSAWPGGLIVRSTDGGQTWDDLEGFTDPVSMGTARTSIGAGVTNLIDATNNFLVDMISGELESVTELQMLNGANHFAYGAHGRWEIIAARDCVLEVDGSYLLRNFLRGRFGTEHNMTNHGANDTLVLLTDPDLSFIVMNSNQIGQAKLYRGVTADQDIDTDTRIEFTYHGVNLKPLSPVYLNGHRHPTTRDWTLTWVRRGRISPEWRDLVDVPVGEATQAYEIEIWNSAYTTLYRTLTSATQTVDYTSAQQVTDFGNNQDTLYIRVFQMSAIIGRGYPLQASITRS